MKDTMENNGTIEGGLRNNGKIEETLESSDIHTYIYIYII